MLIKKCIVLLLGLLACNDTNQISDQTSISVKFSPKGGIAQSIVNEINSAKSNIRIQAFSFTSTPIALALIEAKDRNVNVEAILDREVIHNKNSVLNTLYTNHIPVYIDDKHAIAHNKIIIIDNKIFTGSYNFSRGAEEHNAENSILIENIKITNLYLDNYNLHREHSNLYSPDNFYAH